MNANAASSATTKSEQTRQKLLGAGIELFSMNGYDATSTRNVEAHANVQRNLINYHFGNKEAFWKACVTEMFRRGTEMLRPALQQSRDIESGERVRFLIRQFVRMSAAHPEITRIMFDEGRRDNWRLEWIVEAFGRGFYDTVKRLFDDGRAQGVIPDLTVTQFYYVLVSSAAIFAMAPECRLLSGEEPTDDAMVDAQADAIARLLTPQNEPHDERRGI